MIARYPQRVLVASILAVLIAGCVVQEKPGQPTTKRMQNKFSQDRLHGLERELRQLTEYVDAEVDRVTSQLLSNDNTTVRKAALRWKLAMSRHIRHDVQDDHPVADLLDSWASAKRIQSFFLTGAGKDVFKDQQHIVVEMMGEIVRQVDQLIVDHLDQADRVQLSTDVETFVTTNPIRSIQAMEMPVSFSQTQAVANTLQFQWQPFSWIGGVRDAVDPTLRLSQSVDSFNELAAQYPTMMRDETQLLLIEINEADSVVTTVESLERLSHSSERYADIGEALPGRLRAESTALIEDSHEAIKTVDSALGKAERLGTRIEGTVGDFNAAGTTWEKTADAVTRTIEQIQRWTPHVLDPSIPKPTPRPDGQRFDINDYTRVAEAVGETSVELRELLGDVREFVDGAAPGRDTARIETLAAGLLDPGAAQARDLVDLIAYRAAQVVALVFLLATVYTFISRRLIGPRKE